MTPPTSSTIAQDYRRRLATIIVDHLRLRRRHLHTEAKTQQWASMIERVMATLTPGFRDIHILALAASDDLSVGVNTAFGDTITQPYVADDHVQLMDTYKFGVKPHINLDHFVFPGACFSGWRSGQHATLTTFWHPGRVSGTVVRQRVKDMPEDVIKQLILRKWGNVEYPLQQHEDLAVAYQTASTWFPDGTYWPAAEVMMTMTRQMYDVFAERLEWWTFEKALLGMLGTGNGAALRWQELGVFFPEIRGLLSSRAVQSATIREMLTHLDSWRDRGAVRSPTLFIPSDAQNNFLAMRGKLASLMAKDLLQV